MALCDWVNQLIELELIESAPVRRSGYGRLSDTLNVNVLPDTDLLHRSVQVILIIWNMILNQC